MTFLRFVVWLTAATLLAMRYKVRVEGMEAVRGLRKTLILPNHPAHIDPPLVLRTLWPILKPRPLILGTMFRSPLLAWLPKMMDALLIPGLDTHSVTARDETEAAIRQVIDGLKQGQNLILWPAGRAQRGGVEQLRGTRSVCEILAEVGDANVLLVRTRGLRGSMFSYARTGRQPGLMGNLAKGIGLLIANLGVLMPRREVHITLELLARDALPPPRRTEMNPFLEAWYNRPGPESPVHVPYHFLFGARGFSFPPPAEDFDANPLQVDADIRKKVMQVVAQKAGDHLLEKEHASNTPLDDLGLDSIDRMEIALTIERQFGFASARVPVTLGDLYLLASGLAETPSAPGPSKLWHRKPSSDRALRIQGDTLPQAFVHAALAHPSDVVAADDLSGIVTYRRFLVAAQLMARRFEQIKAPNVGIMLPASVATDIVFFALHLAGKLPVLMNWTTGSANLAHAVRTMQLTHVVSSRRFVDRSGVKLEGVQMLHLEDLRKSFGKVQLLGTLLATSLLPGRVGKRLPAKSPDDHAVVLFTSGSEKAPKTVPLTHRNLLSNVEGVFAAYGLNRNDVLLGFLPLFHSFGLTMTCLLPILGGGRVVHHPDPTDAGALVRKAAAYGATVICGTPTFVGHILDRVREQELDSLRVIIVGAEKCPRALFERAAQVAPNAQVLEGYGITECSPFVSCNRLDDVRPASIGPPLPNLNVAIVDPQTMSPLPAGQVGMLLVRGPNVFGGYLDFDGPQPFHTSNGHQWFVTGDLVRKDEKGYLYFEGRLKRFIKAAGEMISLPALEEPFTQRFAPTEDGPRVAVEGIETESGKHIVLFTPEDLSLQDANACLQEHGFHGILRLDEVRMIDRIPVLGTGKTDYKQLRGMIENA